MKKNFKILSMVMAIVMIFSIFTVCAFAGDNDYTRYVTASGSATGKGTKSNPWSLDDLLYGTAVDTINEKIAGGDRTGVVINVSSEEIYYSTLVLNGIKGTATTPVTVVCNYNAGALDGEGSSSNLTTEQGNAIDIIDCSFITIKNINISAINGDGIHVKDSSDIVIENVDSYIANQSVTKTMNNPIEFEGENSNITITGCDFSFVEAPIVINSGVANISYSNGSVEYSKGAALVVDGLDGFTLDGFTAKAAYFVETPEVAEGEEIPEVEPVLDAAVVIKNSKNINFTNATITDCNGPAISLVDTTNTTISKVFSSNNASFMINDLKDESYVCIAYCISACDSKLPTVFSISDTSVMGLINNTFYKPYSLDMSKLVLSVIANNIYDMELLGEVKIAKDNYFDTNCYHYTMKNDDDDAVLAHPQYANSQTMTGLALNDFILDDDSPMIEAGTNIFEKYAAVLPVSWFVLEDMFGNEVDYIDGKINIGAYAGEGVQVKQSDEVNQTTDKVTFYYNVVKAKVKAFIDKIIPAPVQNAVSGVFSKIVEWASSAISKIIGAFTNR